MEETRLVDELTRALWYGLTGRSGEVRRVLAKAMPEVARLKPDLATRLDRLLSDSLNADVGGVTREHRTAEAPVDPDSRMELLQFTPKPNLPIEPIWNEEVAQSLHQLVKERRAKSLLEKAGLSPSRTALFTGPPGVGKTMAAHWIAREFDLPIYTLNLSTVVSSYLGRTGANIRQVFSFAQKQKCVLFLDELDAIAKRRDDASDVGELKRLVTVLLQEFDAWPKENLLIAATNHADLLDRAVWRRFEIHVAFSLPNYDQLIQAIILNLGQQSSMDKKSIEVVASALKGSSFSDVGHIVGRARREALISKSNVADEMIHSAANHARTLPKDALQSLARTLTTHGFSQRDIHRLTGLARETIRKATNAKVPRRPGT